MKVQKNAATNQKAWRKISLLIVLRMVSVSCWCLGSCIPLRRLSLVPTEHWLSGSGRLKRCSFSVGPLANFLEDSSWKVSEVGLAEDFKGKVPCSKILSATSPLGTTDSWPLSYLKDSFWDVSCEFGRSEDFKREPLSKLTGNKEDIDPPLFLNPSDPWVRLILKIDVVEPDEGDPNILSLVITCQQIMAIIMTIPKKHATGTAPA